MPGNKTAEVMTSLAKFIAEQVASGIHRIGQIEIQSDDGEAPYQLCHADDVGAGGLEVHQGPSRARELSTWGDDGEYRFAKASINLRRGWRMVLADAEQLRQAIDGFYPAALGLWRAESAGVSEVQDLREKLGRQTGMYKFAGNISDQGAQRLVQEVCGPAHQCAKRILWQIDEDTPLEDSEVSRYRGIVGDLPGDQAIPLLCREACNHFVAECRKVSKREHEERLSP